MNKKKMILTSLASVAILGAGFVTSQPTVVRAEESPQAVEKSSSEKEYEKAKAKADTAKKNYEEAKKKAEDAKKKYDEDQKKTEEKAAKELKASKEIAEATSQVQNGYVEYLKVQSATNINIKERQKN
ncbi:TPA: hypothetical protein ACL44K_000979 [Streptococcus pneumoniae]